MSKILIERALLEKAVAAFEMNSCGVGICAEIEAVLEKPATNGADMTAPTTQSREAFEVEAAEQGLSTRVRLLNRVYDSSHTHMAYHFWQAGEKAGHAAAMVASAVAERDELRESLRKLTVLTQGMQGENSELRTQLEAESKAASHWMQEANKEHNENVRLQAERDELHTRLNTHSDKLYNGRDAKHWNALAVLRYQENCVVEAERDKLRQQLEAESKAAAQRTKALARVAKAMQHFDTTKSAAEMCRLSGISYKTYKNWLAAGLIQRHPNGTGRRAV